MFRLFKLFVVMMLVSGPVFAQAKPAAEKTAEQKATEAQIRANQAAAEARILAEGQPVNVRLDLTITDQRGDGPGVSKTVTMMTADRYFGRIRTQGDVRTPTGFRPVILNVDAKPTLLRDGKARVELNIEYRPVAGEAETERSTTPNINESITVMLEDGKSTVISQSADPVTDRKVKIEAKITLVR